MDSTYGLLLPKDLSTSGAEGAFKDPVGVLPIAFDRYAILPLY